MLFKALFVKFPLRVLLINGRQINTDALDFGNHRNPSKTHRRKNQNTGLD